MKGKSIWIFLGISGFWLAIYLASLSLLPSGYADSDELATVAIHRNLAHPPGYSGLTDLTHGLIRAMPGLPPSLIANTTSAIFHAFGLLFTGLWLKELGIYFGLKKGREEFMAHMASWITMMVLGSSFFWWTYATIYEVMPLANLLIAGSLWSATKWSNLERDNKPGSKWYWGLTWLLAGLLVGHYQPAGLLLPGWIALFYKKSRLKRVIGGILIAVMAFLVINTSLFLELMNQHETGFGWHREPGLSGTLKILSRQDLAGFSFAQGRDFKGIYWEKWTDLTSLSRSLWGYLNKLGVHLGWPLTLISLWGLIEAIRKNRISWWPWLAMMGLGGIIFSVYVDESGRLTDQALFSGVAERQLFMGEILLMAWFWWAVIQIGLSLKKQGYVVIILGIGLVLGQFGNNYHLITDKVAREMVHQSTRITLNQLDPGAMIICTTDIDCYSLIYANEVERIRPDVLVMPYVSSYRIGYLLTNPKTYPYRNFNEPDYLPQLIAWNLKLRPVYLTQGINQYMDYSGLESGPFYLQPEGSPPVFRVVEEIPAINPLVTESKKVTCDPRDSYCRGIMASWSNIWAYAGYLGLKYRAPGLAKEYLEQAIKVDPDNLQAQNLLLHLNEAADELAIKSDQLKARDYFQKGTEAMSLKDGVAAETNLRYATYLEPTNPEYLQGLMDFYRQNEQQARYQELNYFFLSNLSSPSDLTP